MDKIERDYIILVYIILSGLTDVQRSCWMAGSFTELLIAAVDKFWAKLELLIGPVSDARKMNYEAIASKEKNIMYDIIHSVPDDDHALLCDQINTRMANNKRQHPDIGQDHARDGRRRCKAIYSKMGLKRFVKKAGLIYEKT